MHFHFSLCLFFLHSVLIISSIFCFSFSIIATVSFSPPLLTISPSQILHGPKDSGAEADTAATSKLELLGYNAGFRLIERLAKDYPKFKDELDLLKFICKDFWVAVFRFLDPLTRHDSLDGCRKQIDNLRTNHQGVYVLQDNSFKFLTKASCDR